MHGRYIPATIAAQVEPVPPQVERPQDGSVAEQSALFERAVEIATWAARNPIVSITLAGVVLSGVLRAEISLFYSRFNLTPEDVGLGYGELLSQSAAGLVIIVLLYWVGFSWAATGTNLSSTVWRLIFRWSTLFNVVVLVAFVAWYVHSGATIYDTARWTIAAAVGLTLLRDELAPRKRKEPVPVRRSLVESVAWRSVFRVLLVATGLVIFAYLPIQALQDANDLASGHSVRGLLSWGGSKASITWTAGTPPTGFTRLAADCLMYMGQANGVAVFYDVTTRQTVRLPAASLGIEESPSLASKC